MRRTIKNRPEITVEPEAIAAWLDKDAHRRAAETTLSGDADLDDYYSPLAVRVNGTPYRVYNIVRHNDDKLLVVAAPVDPNNPVEGNRFYFAVELDGEPETWRPIGHIVLGTAEEDPRQVYWEIMSK